tara:strand:- start:2980 stop:4974 length:1995 start_codon:yes stop_codon:yes gene_type:complete
MALGDDVKKAKEEAQDFKEIMLSLDSTLASLAVTFANGFGKGVDDAVKKAEKLTQVYERDLSKAVNQSIKDQEAINKLQDQASKGKASEAKVASKLADIESKRQSVLDKIDNAKREGLKIDYEEANALVGVYNEQEKITKEIKDRVKAQDASLGAVGKISGAFTGLLNKLGMGDLNKFFNLDKANEQSKVQLEKLGKSATAGQKISTVTKNIFKNLDMGALAAGALFKLAGSLVDQFKKADQSTTDIARGLSMSKKDAKEFKKEMMETSGSFLSTAVSLKEQKKTVFALNKELGGTAIAFNKDILAGAADTLNRLHLSEEAVGNMAKLAMVTGKNFKTLEKEQAKGVLDAEREFGVRLKLSDVLDEANKITGLARVNAMGIEGGLTKAVATAKSLGIEMSAVASSAGQLLDFESSIQNELQAELLIGRDLNLEKARAAALAGDQEALARALVEEAGSLEELQGMNVIQQQALAGALGMSADQLADSLVTQEALASQSDKALDRDAQEALNNEKMLSLTEKQTLAMEKFAATVQMLGPLLLVAAAAAAAIAIAVSFGTATPLVVGGILATAAVVGGITAAVQDGVAPPGSGPFTITDKFGATTVTAAGDGLAVSPNINTQGGAGGNANMSETNMLLKQILNKEGTVKMDSTEVGTAFAVGSRQIQ